MAKKMKLGIFFVAALTALLLTSVSARAQQTLGGITGTVTDKSGSVLPDTTVTIVGDQTKLTRSLKTNGNGAYDFVNLPIGTYTITVTHDGFESERLPSILVQANRTDPQRHAESRAGRNDDRRGSRAHHECRRHDERICP
jgi:hypothetical protein